MASLWRRRHWLQYDPPNLLTADLRGKDRFFGAPGQPPTYDWPNPLQPRRLVQAEYQSSMLVGPLAVPFSCTDWPLPQQVGLAQENRSFTRSANVQLVGLDRFFAAPGQAPTYDYPNPPQPRRLVQSDFQTSTLVGLLAIPFAMVDWPVPQRARQSQENQSFVRAANTQLIGKDRFFGAPGEAPQYDWPNPLLPRRIVQADSQQDLLTTLFVQATISITGTVYSDQGVTPDLSGLTINCSVNGAASSGTATSSTGNGSYALTGVAAPAGAVLTVYLQGNTSAGATVTTSSGISLSGVDIWESNLNVRSDGGAPFTGANMHTAVANGATGISNVLTATTAVFTNTKPGISLTVMPGQVYAPGGSALVGVGGSWNNLGTFTCDTGTVSLRGSGTYTFNPGSSAYWNVTFANSGAYTLLGPVTVANNWTFSTGAETVDCGGFNIIIGGTWSNLGEATFVYRAATVTFSGTNQFILGSTSWYNLKKTVTTADTFTIDYDEQQTINGTLTLQGAPGQLLSLTSVSPPGTWNLDILGGQSASYLAVANCDAIGTTFYAGATSTDGGNNTNVVFGPVPAPFLPVDFPNPIQARQPLENSGFIRSVNAQLIGLDKFFAAPGQGPVYNWPLPSTPRHPIHLEPPPNLLTVVLLVHPFALTEWPNPQVPRQPQESRGFTRSANVQLIGQDRLPFVLTEWPNPQRPRYPLQPEPLPNLTGVYLPPPPPPPVGVDYVWTEGTRGIVWSEATRLLVWAGTQQQGQQKVLTLLSRTLESAIYAYDFSNDAAILAGDSISSVTSVTAIPQNQIAIDGSLPALGTPTVSGKQVRVMLTAPSEPLGVGGQFLMRFTVQTTAGLTRVGLGFYVVSDQGP